MCLQIVRYVQRSGASRVCSVGRGAVLRASVRGAALGRVGALQVTQDQRSVLVFFLAIVGLVSGASLRL